MKVSLTQLFDSSSPLYSNVDNTILLIQADLYQPLVIARFIDYAHTLMNVVYMSTDSFISYNHTQQLSFLTSCKTLYWLGDISSITAGQLKDLITLSKICVQKASIGFFYTKAVVGLKPTKNDLYTLLECQLHNLTTQKDVLKLYASISNHVLPEGISTLVSNIVSTSASITPDEAHQILSYGSILSNISNDAISDYMQHIIRPDISLFSIAGLFFTGSALSFFRTWYSIVDLYTDQFWVSFLSDQLFRAYCYKHALLGTTDSAIIKQASARLPFSFITKDHRYISLSKLQQSHHCLMQLDCNFKNGDNSAVHLIVFFAQWFAKDN